MKKRAPETQSSGESEQARSQPLCKCGRGPWRKGQRNCRLCNREANAKYRASLGKMVSMPANRF